jgi:hypothetical protein
MKKKFKTIGFSVRSMRWPTTSVTAQTSNKV